jgi:hypothetical protein
MKKLIYLVFLVLLGSNLVQAQNRVRNAGIIRGSHNSVKKELQLAPITGFGLSAAADVVLKQGDSQTVFVEVNENLLPNLNTDVEDGYWKISFEGIIPMNFSCTVYITVPDLKTIRLSGAGDIETEGTFRSQNELHLSISGAGDMNMNLVCPKIEAKISGVGDATLTGETDELILTLSGVGDFDGHELRAKNANVHISGIGSAYVDVSDNLEAKVSGIGGLTYSGQPKVVSKVSGLGGIHPNRGRRSE